MRTSIDLTDKRFGRLTVIERAEDYIEPKSNKRIARWLCKCDCGNEILVIGKNLTKKKYGTKSCGCLRSESITKFNKETKKKFNTYDLSGEYGIGYTSNNEEFWFDLDDYSKIKDYCWCVGSKGSIITNDENGNTLLLHRVILDIDDLNIQIDHIKHRRYDNRKSQLRIVDNGKNQMNTRIRADNTSGYKGISWNKNLNKWYAYINVNKKRIHLGFYSEFNDAVAARKSAEEKYHGEYSYDNSMGYIDE